MNQLTKREQIAAMIYQGMIACPNNFSWDGDPKEQSFSDIAISITDTLLEKLAATEKKPQAEGVVMYVEDYELTNILSGNGSVLLFREQNELSHNPVLVTPL